MAWCRDGRFQRVAPLSDREDDRWAPSGLNALVESLFLLSQRLKPSAGVKKKNFTWEFDGASIKHLGRPSRAQARLESSLRL